MSIHPFKNLLIGLVSIDTGHEAKWAQQNNNMYNSNSNTNSDSNSNSNSKSINDGNNIQLVRTQRSGPLWIVIANDHSFFIPSNLYRYLSSLSHQHILYTGNRLQRGAYRGFDLYFASGGAGAAISHVSLKLFLLTLAINRNKYLIDALESLSTTGKASSTKTITTITIITTITNYYSHQACCCGEV